MKPGVLKIDALIDNFMLELDDEESICFCFLSGRKYSSKDIEKILQRSFMGQGIEYRGIVKFQEIIEGKAGQ